VTASDSPPSRRPRKAEQHARERLAWDRVAWSLRDFSQARSTRYYRRCEIALIQRWLGPLAGQRVIKLDLWNEAFNTRILHWMAEQGAAGVALDGSGVVAARARAKSLRLYGHFVVAGATTLPPAGTARRLERSVAPGARSLWARQIVLLARRG
jgi:hypothetical protein